MNWTEPKQPTKEISHYDHITCETPLGQFKIEWKGWKENPDYSIEIGNNYIGDEYSLEDAKEVAKKYLVKKYEELKEFINQ